MPKPSNPCSKWVEPEEAYEVWQSFDGTWTYFVLKKYQSPEQEATNPYARWFCMVKSPSTTERGDWGDVYMSTVKRGTRRVDNPLHRTMCLKGTSITTLENIGLSTYRVTDLALTDERLGHYLKLSIPPKAFAKVKRLLEKHEIALVCIDAPDCVERCLTDVQSSETEGEQPHGTLDTGA
ncbi:MAG TPA: hypothetical protein VEL31_12375 [Ktedonobacteraceae bacterium]|nr:hypothetical protein [Ktedonobacteraceae bacterium]